MAKKGGHISREELERDEVAENFTKLVGWIGHNKGKAIGGLVVVLALAGMGYAWTANQASVQIETSRILSQSTRLYREIPSLDDAADRDQRMREIITSLENDLITRYADSQAAHAGLLLKGNCYFQLDELDNAIKDYEAYLRGAETPEERATAEVALGNSYENKFYLDPAGDTANLDKAATYYEKATKTATPKSYAYYQALLDQARVLELRSRDAEALEIYRKVIAERPAPVASQYSEEDENAPIRSMIDFARRTAVEQKKGLSFTATAQLRADRLGGIAETPATEEPVEGESAVEPAEAAPDAVATEAAGTTETFETNATSEPLPEAAPAEPEL